METCLADDSHVPCLVVQCLHDAFVAGGDLRGHGQSGFWGVEAERVGGWTDLDGCFVRLHFTELVELLDARFGLNEPLDHFAFADPLEGCQHGVAGEGRVGPDLRRCRPGERV